MIICQWLFANGYLTIAADDYLADGYLTIAANGYLTIAANKYLLPVTIDGLLPMIIDRFKHMLKKEPKIFKANEIKWPLLLIIIDLVLYI